MFERHFSACVTGGVSVGASVRKATSCKAKRETGRHQHTTRHRHSQTTPPIIQQQHATHTQATAIETPPNQEQQHTTHLHSTGERPHTQPRRLFDEGEQSLRDGTAVRHLLLSLLEVPSVNKKKEKKQKKARLSTPFQSGDNLPRNKK